MTASPMLDSCPTGGGSVHEIDAVVSPGTSARVIGKVFTRPCDDVYSRCMSLPELWKGSR